ncbi:hypothetical protein ACE1ET_17205 [Saccharicrinis sp. FJH62]|uniref:anti-sigma factor family protein n=1 Tax=Saccharicrinis sp. FJH62 TaxID=3344657 RepID=UPI0035D405CE
MGEWMNKIMLTCLEATKLTVQKSFRKLSFTEKLQLKMHHTVCHACRKFDSQNTFIDHAVKTYIESTEKNNDLKLSDRRKKVISDAMHEL